MNGDGIMDLVSGEYGGKITLYKGSKDGFEAPIEIKQKTDIKNNKIFYDYLFTNPTLADYNGDGLLDAFIGGAKGMRYMLNEGTKENPSFGERLPLLDVDGKQIDFIDMDATKPNNGVTCSDFKSYVKFIDWDRDGINDIIASSSYYDGKVEAIYFFKGVKTDNGIRFEKRVPLFKAKDGSKALPGSIIIPHFYDMNNDGALDILIGISSSEIEANDKKMAQGYVLVIQSQKHYK